MVRLVRLEVGPAILKALIKRRWLGKADTDDLGAIAAALDDLIDCWALAYDRLQWIIQYRTSAKGKPEKWSGVSFISSNRDILVLTLREKGIVADPEKMEKVLALPYTFKEWIAQRRAEEEAGARPGDVAEAA